MQSIPLLDQDPESGALLTRVTRSDRIRVLVPSVQGEGKDAAAVRPLVADGAPMTCCCCDGGSLPAFNNKIKILIEDIFFVILFNVEVRYIFMVKLSGEDGRVITLDMPDFIWSKGPIALGRNLLILGEKTR